MSSTDAVLKRVRAQLATLDAAELRAEIERYEATMADLQEKMAARRQVLALIESFPPEPAPAATKTSPQPPATPELRRLGAKEKTRLIFDILAARPRWSPKAVSDALRERGLDPNAGTEVKRILWQLARDGQLVRFPETGEYGLIGLNNGNGASHAPLEGLGV